MALEAMIARRNHIGTVSMVDEGQCCVVHYTCIQFGNCICRGDWVSGNMVRLLHAVYMKLVRIKVIVYKTSSRNTAVW